MEAGSIKKRKICLVDADLHDHPNHHHRSDDDNDDKEKMEKFFSLIRSIREARDHLSKGSADAVLVQMAVQDQEEGIIIKNKKQQQQQKSCNVNNQEESKKQKKAGWNINMPCFQREDFVDDLNLRISPPALTTYLAPPASSDQINIQANGHEDDIIKHGLDLNLSL